MGYSPWDLRELDKIERARAHTHTHTHARTHTHWLKEDEAFVLWRL